MNRTWYFLPKPEDVNDATEYYVRTLERAARDVGYALKRVDAVRHIPHRANVLAIDCRTAFTLAIARPRCRVWLWLQGIVPEEVELHRGTGWRNRVRKAYWTAFERIAIPRARGVIMVSDAMKQHYAAKYRLRALPSVVMPCVNQELNDSSFFVASKYSAPTFVYAGSLQRWQCFDVTLRVFRRVRQDLPRARLTVYTADGAEASRALSEAGLQDVVAVTKVSLHQLQHELGTYKYGFVLRDHHSVNAVATPTKVSSYMAAGVIPVTTTAVHDFAVHLGSLQHVIMSPDLDVEAVATRILAFERRTVFPTDVLAEYRGVFESYLRHERYLPELVAFFRTTGLAAAGTSLRARGGGAPC